jgi:acyl carrier protein
VTSAWNPGFEAALREAVPDLLPSTALEPSTELFALGVSSLQLVSLVVNLELAYGVEFPAEALLTANTLGDLWHHLRRLRTDRVGGA